MAMMTWLVNDGARTGTQFSVAPKALSSITQLFPLPQYPSSQPLSQLLLIFQDPVHCLFFHEVSIILKQGFQCMSPLYLVNSSVHFSHHIEVICLIMYIS